MQPHKDIRYLKGVGEKRAKLYEKLGITDLATLLEHYPRSYIDLTQPVSIAGAPREEAVPVRAAVVSKTGEQRIRRGLSLFKVVVTDHSSDMVITFFNTKFTVEGLKIGEEYIFYGKVEGTLTKRTMASPLIFRLGEGEGLIPIYPLTEGLSSKLIRENIRQALDEMKGMLEDPLPKDLREKYHLCHKSYAVQNIHFPPDREAMEIAKNRLIFEELLFCQLAFLQVRNRNRRLKTQPMQEVSLAPALHPDGSAAPEHRRGLPGYDHGGANEPAGPGRRGLGQNHGSGGLHLFRGQKRGSVGFDGAHRDLSPPAL